MFPGFVSWPYGPIASTFHTPIRVPLQPVQRLDFISDKDSTCAHLGGLIPPPPLGPNTFKDPPSRGAPVNGWDESGWTALHYSAFAGSLEATRLLLESQGDCNAVLPDLSTPLMLAVDEAHLPVAKLLLQHGALSKCKDEDGFTALARCDQSVKEEFRILVSGSGSEFS
eukprot:symbB.v1.2.013191.t1/scaffold927.1/size151520/11